MTVFQQRSCRPTDVFFVLVQEPFEVPRRRGVDRVDGYSDSLTIGLCLVA
jgi:hypothetical protein